VGLDPTRQRLERSLDRTACQIESRQVPLDAHQEQAHLVVNVLVGLQDVHAVLKDKIRNARHQPFPVGARNQQNGARAPC